jgi:hypothetical protein
MRPERHRLVGGERERRAAELGRVDAEQEVVHDRVADEGQLEDLAGVDPGAGGDLVDQHADCLAHRAGQLDLAARVHHHVADPAHQILAVADLRVHQPGRRQHLAARQIAKMRGDRRRADVDREAIGAVVEVRPDADDPVSGVHRHGHFPRALAERLLQALQAPEVAGEIAELPLLGERLL